MNTEIEKSFKKWYKYNSDEWKWDVKNIRDGTIYRINNEIDKNASNSDNVMATNELDVENYVTKTTNNFVTNELNWGGMRGTLPQLSYSLYIWGQII